jgi:hypothetical protein
METVCSYCGITKSKKVVVKPSDFKDDYMISHGACKECAEKVLKDLEGED